MRPTDDGAQADPRSGFHRAVALAASLVEGSATVIGAADADAVHHPLVAVALLGRGRRDPVFARKLVGRHGAWLVDPTDEDFCDIDEEDLATLYVSGSTDARSYSIQAP